MKGFSLFIMLLAFIGCGAQEAIPTRLAYERPLRVINVANDTVTFSAYNGRILLKARDADFKRGDELDAVFEIKRTINGTVHIVILKAQISRGQWWEEYKESRELLKREGYSIEPLPSKW